MTRSYTNAHLLGNLLWLSNDFHKSPHELFWHGKLASAINKQFPKLEAEFHTHALFLKLLHSWIHLTCDAPVHFWGCTSTNTGCSGMWEAAVCCQNLQPRNRNCHILLNMAIWAPLAKFDHFLEHSLYISFVIAANDKEPDMYKLFWDICFQFHIHLSCMGIYLQLSTVVTPEASISSFCFFCSLNQWYMWSDMTTFQKNFV